MMELYRITFMEQYIVCDFSLKQNFETVTVLQLFMMDHFRRPKVWALVPTYKKLS